MSNGIRLRQFGKHRRIHPLGFRVLVRIEKIEDTKTDSGLYLPEGSREQMLESHLAEVLEVASATDDSSHEETNISGIPRGVHVLIPRNAGIRVPWDDSLRIVESKEVLGIVESISLA